MVTTDLLVQFFITAIVLSVVVLLFNFLTGRFLDVSIEKSNLQEYSKAMNMLHVIGNFPELVAIDKNDEPIKLVFDSKKLDSFNNKGKELECCNYVDFDYWVEIVDLYSTKKWNVGFPEKYINTNFQEGKKCLTIDSGKSFAIYSIPATVKDGSSVIPGNIRMKLIKTPLSNIAFNVVRACKTNYEIEFPVYNIQDITVNNGDIDTICVKLNSAENGISSACKKIACGLTIEKVSAGGIDEQICDKIIIKREGNGVKIIV